MVKSILCVRYLKIDREIEMVWNLNFLFCAFIMDFDLCECFLMGI